MWQIPIFWHKNNFYNDQRGHYALDGETAINRTGRMRPKVTHLIHTAGIVTAEVYTLCLSRPEHEFDSDQVDISFAVSALSTLEAEY